MEEKYPSEVKESILLKALYSISNARKEGRLSWDGKLVGYKTRFDNEYKVEIDEMPQFFLDRTLTSYYVEDLVGDIKVELKEIFIKVLNSTKEELDTNKIAKEIEDKMNILRQKSKEQGEIIDV